MQSASARHRPPAHLLAALWQLAFCSRHELVLSALADITHAAGYITNRGKRVPTGRGQKRGDLEIKRLQVAGTSDLVIDVAMVQSARQCLSSRLFP
jgi:hypothetical protein